MHAPWKLNGDAHVLAAWLPKSLGPREQFIPQGTRGRQPGLGLMMFNRYLASNAGPYDELLWLPLWGVRIGRRWRHSVTRIFVSSQASQRGGRDNWGIPKELANFEVTRLGPLAANVTVTLADDLVAAFSIESSPYSLRANAAWLPHCARTLVQELDGQRFRFTPSAQGRIHCARFSKLRINPAHFPDVTLGRRLLCFSLRNMRMWFPEARVTRS